ncbi:MAG: hypothetical protein ACK5V3_01530 [Bdellovibrionales bacterium]
MHFLNKLKFLKLLAVVYFLALSFVPVAYGFESGFQDENKELSAENDLYSIRLEKIKNFSSFNTQNLRGQPSLWVSFQPSCSSCKVLLNSLNCLPDNVHLLALGVGGLKKDLAHSLRPLNFQGEGVMASVDLLRKIPMFETPTILIVNTNGILKKRIVGVTDCEILKTEFFNSKPKEI